MSKHKFTADRSDMAHNIKRALLGSTAVQPPAMPVHEEGVVYVSPSRTGKSEMSSEVLRQLISNGEVIIKEKPRGA